MPAVDYIFVDDSGDLGDGNGDSSAYYGLCALHITDDGFPGLIEHLASLRYHRGLVRELKLGVRKHKAGVWEFELLTAGLRTLVTQGAASVSAVYVTKQGYSGPYLKTTSPRGRKPVWFRNFILRQLLEFHLGHSPAHTEQIDLVLDRFEVSQEERDNLESYLRGNYSLPALKHITHADSLYVEALQATHHIAAALKSVATGTAPPELQRALDFVRFKDVTHP